MKSILKTILGRSFYLILGIALFVIGSFLLKASCIHTNASRYIERKSERELIIAGLFLMFFGVVSFMHSVSKKKDWKNETIKLTGNKINNNPEVNVELDNFTIEPLMLNYDFKCIKTNVVYHGYEKRLTVCLADKADYDKIAATKKINISGELTEDSSILVIENAKLIHGGSTIIDT